MRALFVLALSGCLPGMVGTGGGGGGGTTDTSPPQRSRAKEATLEEHVAETRRSTAGIPTIARSLAAPSDLFLTLDDGSKRISPMHSRMATGIGGFMNIAFGGLVDDKLCFVDQASLGAKVGERKAEHDVRERFTGTPGAVYFVDDLASLEGAVWPPPSTATSLEDLEVLVNELDYRDHRSLTYQLCAPKPDMANANYLVVVQHTPAGAAMLEGGDGERYKFYMNNVFLWKLTGDGASPPATKSKEPSKEPIKDTAAPVKGTGGGMSLVSGTVEHGALVKVRFSPALKAKPGEKFWITIVAAGANDNAYTSYEYLVDASSIELGAPAVAGEYEVRLHGNYPTKTYNLIGRAKLTVR